MKWIAGAIIVLALVVLIVGWRATRQHHPKGCGGFGGYCYRAP